MWSESKAELSRAMDRYIRSLPLLFPGARSGELVGFEGRCILKVLEGLPSRFWPSNPADENLVAAAEYSMAEYFLDLKFSSHKVLRGVFQGNS